MTNKEILDYICCPTCKRKLIINQGELICSYCDREFGILSSNIISLLPKSVLSEKTSLNKWKKLYQKRFEDKSYWQEMEDYRQNYSGDTIAQLKEVKLI